MQLVTFDWFHSDWVARAADLIERRRVTVVVLSADARHRGALVAQLSEFGCQPVDLFVPADVRPYEAWRCPGP